MIPASRTFLAPRACSRESRKALSPAAPAVVLSPESDRNTGTSDAMAARIASSGARASTSKRNSCRTSQNIRASFSAQSRARAVSDSWVTTKFGPM